MGNFTRWRKRRLRYNDILAERVFEGPTRPDIRLKIQAWRHSRFFLELLAPPHGGE